MCAAYGRLVRRLALTLIALAMVALAGSLSSATAAEPTKTAVTSPADPVFLMRDTSVASQQLQVSGTSMGGTTGENLTVKCVPQSGSSTVFGTRSIDAAGAFSGAVPLSADTPTACVIEALPASVTVGDRPGVANPNFTGPRAFIARADLRHDGPPGVVTALDAGTQKPAGGWEHWQTGSCAVSESWVSDPVTLEQSVSPFFCNAWVSKVNSQSATPPTRSQLQVDGVNGYLMDGAEQINPNAPHLPPLLTNFTYDATNGDLTTSSTERASKCSVDTSLPANTTKCADFTPLGVQVETFVTDRGNGSTSQVVQKFSSTDAGQHQLDILWDNEVEIPSANGGVQFPWVDDAYKGHVEGDTVAPPPPGPGSVMVKPNRSGADGTLAGVQGAMTWAAPPESILFINATNSTFTDFELGYHRTVTPDKPVWFGWIFNTGTTPAAVGQAAAAAQATFVPSLALQVPADGSSTTATEVSVTGTAADASGDPVSVSVNGVTAVVASNGTWTAAGIPLSIGPNTLTATAVNRYGTSKTASVTATRTTPPGPGPGPSAHVFTGARFIGATKVRLNRSGRALLRIACPAGAQGQCAGKLVLTSIQPVAAAAKPKRIKLGTHKFRTAAGKTTRVKVRISRAGREVIRRRGRLGAKLVVTSTDGSGQRKTKQATLKLLRAAAPKPRR